ncbi:MAG: DUF6478 family protein, partial [Pseudomonadota bacterium]
FNARIDPGAIANPASGAHFGKALSLHHDASATGSGFLVAQRPRRPDRDGSRFEVFFESYEFDGAYLSLTLETHDALRRPTSAERLVVRVDVAARWPIRGYVRLNLRGVGGEETMYADVMLGEGPVEARFDLAFAPFDLTQEDAFWVDLIFDRPRMTEFSVSDLTLRLETVS